MKPLHEQHCEACRRDAPRVTPQEIETLLPQIPHWQIQTVDGIDQLSRTYRFDNFVDALAFANRIGELAEAEFHHPAILVEWGRVNLRWWSHKIKGLHVNDFVMAAKSDRLYADPQASAGA